MNAAVDVVFVRAELFRRYVEHLFAFIVRVDSFKVHAHPQKVVSLQMRRNAYVVQRVRNKSVDIGV